MEDSQIIGIEEHGYPRFAEDKLRALVSVMERVHSEHELPEVLESVVNGASDICGVEACSILLIDSTRRALRFAAASGSGLHAVRDLVVPIGEGIAGWVAEHGRTQVVDDVSEDSRHYRKIADELAEHHQSLAAIPLKVGNRIVGVMEAVHFRPGAAFSPLDIEFLEAFAAQAATAIERAKSFDRLAEQNRDLKVHFSAASGFGEIETINPEFMKVLDIARHAAVSNATILVTGESGSGKELLAQAIHNASPRAGRVFMAINCGAIPENLLESELFGYEKGAFTGAVGRKLGKFELADGGTVFLDEIGELSPALQVKLLRALQERVIERLGGAEPIAIDIRIVAATNRDLESMMRAKQFREDLYYRLNVIPIRLPPLRERKEDIPQLVREFLARIASRSRRETPPLAEASLRALLDYSWPGNIRELQNVVERAVALNTAGPLEFDPIRRREPPTVTASLDDDLPLTFKAAQNRFKREYIARILRSAGGSQAKAAKILDIQRTYLSKLIRELEIEIPPRRPTE